jgi:predicted nucleotidyltransferase
LEAWKKLLFILEFRANFSDGDIPESVLNNKSYLVCKAAHLIPVLLKKKLISLQSILTFLKGVSSKAMRDSIMEALLAAADLNLFSAQDIAVFSESQELLPASLLISLNNKFPEPEFLIVSNEQELAATTDYFTAKCHKNYDDCVKRLSDTEPNRIDWEEGVSRQKILKDYAVIITNSLISGTLAMTTFEEYINSNQNKYPILLAVNSIKVTTEKMSGFNYELATFNAYYFQAWLFNSWQSGEVEVKKIIESTVYRWFHDEIVGWDYLVIFDLKPINLDESTPTEQVCSSSEFSDLAGIIKLIQETPNLAHYFYPAFIIYGSRVKGQGSKYSDLDLAVFIKPGVSLSDQSIVDSLLSEILQLEKIKGKVLQFWLTESANHLAVNNCVPGDYKIIGNSSYGHVLFGGAWFGNFEVIRELHAELLTPYLFSDDKALKSVCLREL